MPEASSLESSAGSTVTSLATPISTPKADDDLIAAPRRHRCRPCARRGVGSGLCSHAESKPHSHRDYTIYQAPRSATLHVDVHSRDAQPSADHGDRGSTSDSAQVKPFWTRSLLKKVFRLLARGTAQRESSHARPGTAINLERKRVRSPQTKKGKRRHVTYQNSSAVSSAYSNRIDGLHHILDDAVAARYMRTFCARTFSVENIDFVRECHQLKILSAMTGSGSVVRRRLVDIANTYVKPGCSSEVNVKGSTRKAALDALEAVESGRGGKAAAIAATTAFGELEREVHMVVIHDLWPRFLQSPEFVQLISSKEIRQNGFRDLDGTILVAPRRAARRHKSQTARKCVSFAPQTSAIPQRRAVASTGRVTGSESEGVINRAFATARSNRYAARCASPRFSSAHNKVSYPVGERVSPRIRTRHQAPASYTEGMTAPSISLSQAVCERLDRVTSFSSNECPSRRDVAKEGRRRKKDLSGHGTKGRGAFHRYQAKPAREVTHAASTAKAS